MAPAAHGPQRSHCFLAVCMYVCICVGLHVYVCAYMYMLRGVVCVHVYIHKAPSRVLLGWTLNGQGWSGAGSGIVGFHGSEGTIEATLMI